MVLNTQSFCVFFTLLFFTLLLLSLVSRAVEVHDITPLRPLAQGQTLVSAGNVFELGFFSPNNSANKYVGIWYKHILPRKVVWVANREKPLAVTDTLAGLTISSNGNLELVAVLLDNGNFVVKFNVGVPADRYLWESFHYPSDTLLPRMLVGNLDQWIDSLLENRAMG
ncbi:hypothetical protein PS2_036629 [Malus domestica]